MTEVSETVSTAAPCGFYLEGGQYPACCFRTGSDKAIAPPLTTVLDVTISDDGLPSPPGSLSVTWEQVSGPGTVTFDPNEFVEDLTVTLSEAGSYELQLTADDGDL